VVLPFGRRGWHHRGLRSNNRLLTQHHVQPREGDVQPREANVLLAQDDVLRPQGWRSVGTSLKASAGFDQTNNKQTSCANVVVI
jgi:hypothetical protein